MGHYQVCLGQDSLGVLQEGSPCLRQNRAFAICLKQFHTKFRFRLADGDAQAGLGDMDTFCDFAGAAAQK